MVTAQVFLRVFLVTLLFVDVNGVPLKGSESQGQNRPSDQHDGSGTGYAELSFYSSPGDASKAMEQYIDPPQYAQAVPDAEYAASDVSFMPAQAGDVGSYLPVQAHYGAGTFEHVPADYDAGSTVPIQAGYAASPPQSGAQANLPEHEWLIAPKAFEEATANTQPQGTSVVGPAPPAPALQSGETSNVVKEAELGNYQHQTEESGYPADHMGPGQPLPLLTMPSHGGGGLWGYPIPYPYPEFDYQLLYGLYPPGTYSTFSRNHEKGTDYVQDIHYLKEHDPDAPQMLQTSEQQDVLLMTT
ncbi:uncharacterized protein LOC110369099 isoform X1 [Fundulus heteroclitus]|uniref:uncharacterized protein LOC110369099 isoform X1 n=1 Tax=Fundulus heteroclitus TaxID=8078 RepID=UPI00165AC8C3|nr:uncharacterized protein LOC110369099 isoform X1 [Fundulus heteroclitus]